MKNILIAGLLILIILIMIGLVGYKLRQASRIAVVESSSFEDVPVWEASIDYLISQDQWKKVNKKFLSTNTKYQTIPIPGLKGAWSIKGKQTEPVFGVSWVPQSVALTDKYILVGSYDGNHKLNSLMFVIDKISGKYIKTVVMPNKTHMGGIAFDSKTKNIWFSNNTRGVSKLSAFNQKEIDQYDVKENKKPIKIEQTVDLPFIKAVSSLCISDGVIYVLIFDIKENSAVIGLPLIDGSIDVDHLLKSRFESRNVDKIIKRLQESGAADYISISTGFKKMQGVGIFKDTAFFSSSYGRSNSKLIVAKKIPIKSEEKIGQGGGFIFQKIKTINMPPYLEQINTSVGDNKLILLFESGALQYRIKTPFVNDRILIIDVDYQSINDSINQFKRKAPRTKKYKPISSNFK